MTTLFLKVGQTVWYQGNTYVIHSFFQDLAIFTTGDCALIIQCSTNRS